MIRTDASVTCQHPDMMRVLLVLKNESCQSGSTRDTRERERERYNQSDVLLESGQGIHLLQPSIGDNHIQGYIQQFKGAPTFTLRQSYQELIRTTARSVGRFVGGLTQSNLVHDRLDVPTRRHAQLLHSLPSGCKLNKLLTRNIDRVDFRSEISVNKLRCPRCKLLEVKTR